MDARLDPAKFARLAEGDAHVARNAGGRASDDAIRSLVISHKLLGTKEWFVIHHTDCGMEGGFKRSSQHLEEEVAMGTRKRRSDRSGRASLPSPGRPPAAGRDERSRFWLAIASRMSSEDAALEAGVSQPVGTRWFRKAGGMPPAMFRSSAKPLSGRYLSLTEREEIALLRVQGSALSPHRVLRVAMPGRYPPASGTCRVVQWSAPADRNCW